MSELYSNAFNFGSSVSTGVDPRTGQYSASLELISLSPFNMKGATYPLTLSFSMFNSLNNGFGTGWTLSSTRYDLQNRLFTRYSGESFKSEAVVAGREVILRDRKLKNVRLVSQSTNLYYVYHKDGTVETLERRYLSSQLALTTSVTFENGEIYDFTYGPIIAGNPCLTEIRHRQTNVVVLRLSYIGVTCSQIEYPDDLGIMQRIVLDYSNNRLTGISIPFSSSVRPSAGYVFNYLTLQNSFLAIERYRTPSGYIEQIQYNATGMRITNTSTIPCVVALNAFPGNGQPAILKNYQYSPTLNFTGFFSGKSQIDRDQDNLYLVSGTYNYSSTERVVENGNVISSTERTFNRFHLLIKEEKTEDGKRLTRDLSYNETAGVNYYQQPANLQLISRIVTVYTDLISGASRQEQEDYQTDQWGNTLQTTHADGTREINDYYPATGEGNNCPADPLGFSRFLKSTVRKAAYGTAADKVTRFSWQHLPAFSGVPLLSGYVCLAQEEIFGLLTKRYGYTNTPTQRQHSLLARIDSSMNNLATSSTFGYQFTTASMTRTETVTGHDGARKQTSETTAFLSGRQLRAVDENGTTVDYRYTPEGQLSEEIISAGTAQEVKRHYSYQYPAAGQGNYWPVMTETTPDGVSRQISYDGMGRVVSIAEQDDDAFLSSGSYTGTYRETFSRQFNVQGLVVTETETDWLWDLSSASPQRLAQPYRQTKHHLYDGWGGLISTSYDDGRVEKDSYDPVTMVSRQGLQGLGNVTSKKNLFGKPETIHILKQNETVYARTIVEYDGFGRKILETDNNGAVIRYEWDIFDRLIRKILPDGTQLDSTYAPFSAAEYIASVSVNNRQYGEASYDGLGRTVRDTVGGRLTQYGYDQGESLPERITTPSGSNQSRSYQYHLGGVLSRIKTPQLNQNFSYFSKTANLQNASENNVDNQYEYYPSGVVKKEQITENRQVVSSCDYRYSMSGALQYYRDALGNEHFYDYDVYGRLQRSRQDEQSATYHYDGFGRLIRIEVQGGHSKLTTTIDYDEFSREIRRVYSTHTSAEILTQSYTPEGRLSQRLLVRDSLVLNNERFEYDSHGRLQNYHCAGIEAPADSTGRILSGQRYHYDQWGNIVRLDNTYGSITEPVFYEYSESDPTQLRFVTGSDYIVELRYDDNGNLISDEKRQTLVYDSKNRLTEVWSQRNELVCRYQYDAQDKLIAQILPDGKTNRSHYAKQRISNAEIGDEKLTWLDDNTHQRLGHTCVTGQQKKDYQYGLLTNGTPCFAQSGNEVLHLSHTPYGFRSLLSASPGMAGAQIDPVTGWYFLGNGYRVFNPALMRFHSPDSWSPFGVGGINPYIYSLGDPVNRMDLNGHLSTASIIGITLASVSLLLAILSFGAAIPAVAASSALLASMAVSSKVAAISVALGAVSDVLTIASLALSEKNSEASSILGWISTGFGAAGLISGGTSTISSFVSKRLTVQGASTGAQNTNVYLNGFTSLTGELTTIDILLTGAGVVTGVAGIGSSIASEFVDERTADILGWFYLGTQTVGLKVSSVSIWRGWQYMKHNYDLSRPQITDNIRIEHFSPFSSREVINSVLETRV